MGECKKANLDAEKVSLTLDHISETIDVMSHIVGRLKRYINNHIEQKEDKEFMFEQRRKTVQQDDQAIKSRRHRVLH